jgi:hypothetical protein
LEQAARDAMNVLQGPIERSPGVTFIPTLKLSRRERQFEES